jgi:ATP-dependent RNA helicase DDX24/MAK5
VKDHLVAAAKHTNIEIAVVVGGMASQKQTRMLRRGPEIVVATPGRLWDLIEDGDPHLSGVTNLRYLAIDETDRMLEKGHFDELRKLLEMINKNKSKSGTRRQNFVLSATLSLVHDLPTHLKHKRNKKALTPQDKLQEIMEMIGVRANPKIVDITRKTATAQTLIESQIRCSLLEKDQYLYYFLVQHPGRTLVFCNSIDCVRRLVNLFQLLDCEPLGLHAQMQQRQRLKNLDRFISNPCAVLIATDVAARGLDIKDVQHVVHYQVPRTAENYVHRSGRTARAQKEGLSIVLIEPGENNTYKKICHTLKRNEELPDFPIDSSIFPSVKKRGQVARELDKVLFRSKKEEVNKSWFKKAAEEADLEYSEASDDSCNAKNEISSLDKAKETSKRNTNVENKRLELKQLLALPLTQHGFSGKYPTKTGQLQLPSDFQGIQILSDL